jgi:Glycosyltransferase family 87
VNAVARRPHLVLAVAAALVLTFERLRGSATLGTSAVWPIAQAIVAGVALVIVWRERDKLRLMPIIALGLAFQLAWIAIHLGLGVAGDHDPVDVYSAQGDSVVHGQYPRSEYPPGAVALFGLEAWLDGGHARTANAFLMIPFQLLCIVAVWALRTRWSRWLAAFVAFWPLNAFYWEFRFDLVPTAFLVAGLVLAHRERWGAAGFALGLGAVAKWTPGLTAVALALWLLRTKRVRALGRHVAGFAVPVLAANVPLLIFDRSDLVAAYTTQTARTVTAESFVYLPLRLFWHARPGYWYFGAADVPPAANRAAVWLQVGAVILVIVLAAFARAPSAAVALAGLAPALFFLTNRIFSPQFFVLVLAAMVVAAGLVVKTRSELLVLLGACAVATTANTVLFQSMLGLKPVGAEPGWTYVSATVFIPTLAGAVWLIGRALREPAHVKPSSKDMPLAVTPGL